MSTTKSSSQNADMNGSDTEQYNWLDRLTEMFDGPYLYFYFREMVHPKPGVPINPRISTAIQFPDDYFAIFVSDKELKSKKQLVHPHSVLIWSTLDIAKSCGNEKSLATETMRMIATLMTLSGIDVMVNNSLYDPEKIIAEKVHL